MAVLCVLFLSVRATQNSNEETLRVVCGGNPEANARYPNNRISNTKYTILTFLPLNLYEQFRCVHCGVDVCTARYEKRGCGGVSAIFRRVVVLARELGLQFCVNGFAAGS